MLRPPLQTEHLKIGQSRARTEILPANYAVKRFALDHLNYEVQSGIEMSWTYLNPTLMFTVLLAHLVKPGVGYIL
ncbi:hypothetical protein EPA93_05380 [Ktedonosporobacter rubrisoli]|uniref:Uncharacterized protein n=1 Tax=Ktedonosporobacter rubrisoli TaxID=2509675 RepID=A0A4P6JK85_KTERU|nr:hypothetical protein [Ktedonosporobacter rubrisoli]QBD75463.1 hypothetical protein EPA93_05380 [Ktedonosporobacter rubrisoli]